MRVVGFSANVQFSLKLTTLSLSKSKAERSSQLLSNWQV